ncbi:MAG: MATE family efflux transporter [Bacteroidaceae bacterium]|nr:MATE family efflux transporter [Bacteroidaceae bacterium]
MSRKQELLYRVRNGGAMTRRDKLHLVLLLSMPAIFGQLSTIVMQYIDTMMVGQLGANATASIGLVSTTCWLFGGLTASIGAGFGVLVAQHIGARAYDAARNVLRQSLMVCMALGVLVSLFCVSIHARLPLWLGGDPEVAVLSSRYFLIWSLTVPVMQLLFLSNGMLRSSGNMKVPMVLGVLMCLLDVFFNFLFIPLWGVAGAAFATTLAAILTTACSFTYLITRSPELRLLGDRNALSVPKLRPDVPVIRRSLSIGLPMTVEHVVFCGAQIACTIIVAPLGSVAIAANTIAIVVESLCYMPGYGIGDAATTLIGQSYGARRGDLIRAFSVLTVGLGMGVMTLLGIVMYFTAPDLMRLMTPDLLVQAEGAVVLRIEAFAEPVYAASIVVYFVFLGLGDMLVPCVMNLASIWLVRIPLAAILARTMGLRGVWLAMCIELTVRGIIFLLRLRLKKITVEPQPASAQSV